MTTRSIGTSQIAFYALIFFFGFGHSAWSSSVSIDCEHLNYLWTTRYYRDFHVAWKLESFVCPSEMATIAETMYELDHTTFSQKNAPHFYRLVTSHLIETSYQKLKPKEDPATASAGGGYLTIHDYFAKQTLEYRTAVLVHEDRHNEDDDPGHVECAHGDLKGDKDGCDAVFYSGHRKGSGYNYAVNYHWWVRDASEVTDLSRQSADSLIRYYVLNRFNKVSRVDVAKFAP